MKKIMCAAIAAVSLSLGSCASFGTNGFIYTDTTAPCAVTSNTIGNKVGQSKRVSVLGIIALGNGGIDAAVKEAGIKKVSHVDVQNFSVLGLFNVATTRVYGE